MKKLRGTYGADETQETRVGRDSLAIANSCPVRNTAKRVLSPTPWRNVKGPHACPPPPRTPPCSSARLHWEDPSRQQGGRPTDLGTATRNPTRNRRQSWANRVIGAMVASPPPPRAEARAVHTKPPGPMTAILRLVNTRAEVCRNWAVGPKERLIERGRVCAATTRGGKGAGTPPSHRQPWLARQPGLPGFYQTAVVLAYARTRTP